MLDGQYRIRWLNPDALGSIDLIDGLWLEGNEKLFGLKHPTEHSESMSIATFDLVPDGDGILFRYGGRHETDNKEQGIFVGDMRINPAQFPKTAVIQWRDSEQQPFEELKVQISRLAAREGDRRKGMATRLSRSSRLAKWKRAWVKARGNLACEACGFAGYPAYGATLDCCFEVHHTRTLKQGERGTELADLALLCANCHSAIHGLGDLTFDDFRNRF